ncbi:MAG: hypothetical protein KGI84_08795, partial [Elusimicrobia bacterium]|nr:hypothetical protein [Elusimicrobiota bacterium]
MATRHTNLLALSIFILLSACSRASFLYKPNKPLWAGHDARAPLFPATAAVLPLIDLTRPAAGEPDLVRAPAGSWPQL